LDDNGMCKQQMKEYLHIALHTIQNKQINTVAVVLN